MCIVVSVSWDLIVALSPTQANELLQSSKQIQSKAEKDRMLRESLRLYQQISQHTDLPLVCSQYRQGRSTVNLSVIPVLFELLAHADKLFQCVSMRASLSCVSQRQIRKIHKGLGLTSTRTESQRMTKWDSKLFKKGKPR